MRSEKWVHGTTARRERRCSLAESASGREVSASICERASAAATVEPSSEQRAEMERVDSKMAAADIEDAIENGRAVASKRSVSLLLTAVKVL